MIEVKGWQKTSLIDYPGKMCSVIFLPYCNFRCPFCQNPGLVKNPEEQPSISVEEVVEYIESKKEWIDGVCVTGGEPTIHKDLPELLEKFKSIGVFVKLDTNGSNPEMLKELIKKGLLDYVAMDIKAPLEKYHIAAGVKVDTEKIKESINIIKNSGIDYEFRATVIPRLHKKEDLQKMAELVKGAKKFAIQQFRPNITLDESFQKEKPYSNEELEEFKEMFKGFFEKIEVRS
ncbi:MAG: anaerobic ribonucleoside-triphosphate reductase activating protein [Candidatus Aenigmatarchaeota archaeon]|nr:MAG: anaerobic ribonucleoside-triphosphate reductase activating protein [Candidatus Aenigmarchaeota archaeon]